MCLFFADVKSDDEVKQKKSNTKNYMPFESIFMNFSRRQNDISTESRSAVARA